MPSIDRGPVQVLALDAELARTLGPRRSAEATARLMADVLALARGSWEPGPPPSSPVGHLGLLVLEGMLLREVTLAGSPMAELLGPGDVLRPWDRDQSDALVPHDLRWVVVAPARLAVLDAKFTRHAAEFPEVLGTLVERASRRGDRIAMHQAVSHLTRVDDRLLALFWALAERFGRMTPDGVVVNIRLSHRALGSMIGARRPSVTTALGQLTTRGDVVRRDDGSWLLKASLDDTPRATATPTRFRRSSPVEEHMGAAS